MDSNTDHFTARAGYLLFKYSYINSLLMTNTKLQIHQMKLYFITQKSSTSTILHFTSISIKLPLFQYVAVNVALMISGKSENINTLINKTLGEKCNDRVLY